jgi:hypothetical protein
MKVARHFDKESKKLIVLDICARFFGRKGRNLGDTLVHVIGPRDVLPQLLAVRPQRHVSLTKEQHFSNSRLVQRDLISSTELMFIQSLTDSCPGSCH